MRTSRLITIGLAVAASLAMLLAAQVSTSAAAETDSAGIQGLSDMKINWVQSRSDTEPNPEDANAVSIINASDVGFTFTSGEIEVLDGAGTLTASYAISNVTFGAWQELIVHSASYIPPGPPTAMTDTFHSEASDAIEGNFTVILSDTSGGSNELDRVAAGSGLNPEGSPATALSSATDEFNAVIRRDVIVNDTGDNATDFLRLPLC